MFLFVVKCFCYFFTLLVPFTLYGQFHIQLVDQNNGEPIPYATILWSADNSQGTSSDIKGRFSIPTDVDSIKILAMGYKDTTVLRSESWGEGHLIILKPVSYSLPEISVKSGSLIRVRYEMDRNIMGRIGVSSIKKGGSHIIGTQFRNIHSGYVNAVSIFFSSICKNCNYVTLRLRIIEFDESGSPGVDLLTKTIEVNPKRNRWHTINLDEYPVWLNGRDFFVGIEWVITRERGHNRETNYQQGSDITRPTNVYMVALNRLESELDKYIGWERNRNGNWYKYNSLELRNVVPLIRVDAQIDY